VAGAAISSSNDVQAAYLPLIARNCAACPDVFRLSMASQSGGRRSGAVLRVTTGTGTPGVERFHG